MTNHATKHATTARPRGIMFSMTSSRKPRRSAAEKARDTASIIGNLKHEGYDPTAEEEAVHQRVTAGEITREQAIAIFRERALATDQALADAQAIKRA